MKTFTAGFPGTLILREYREHPVYGGGFFNYLSADLGDGRWKSVEKWDRIGDSATSEEELRDCLTRHIAA